MTYKPTNKKERRKMIITIISVFAITAVIGLSVYGYITQTSAIEEKYNNKLEERDKQINSLRKKILVATRDIRAGELFSMNNAEYRDVYSDISTKEFLDASYMGKVARMDIPAGSCLMRNYVLLNDISGETREIEYSFIDITSNIQVNDFVDIRIRYWDGTDYVVLAKKQVKNLSDNKLVVDLWVQEEEIQLINSAVVDASLFMVTNRRDASGAVLYATKYIEPNLQKASVVNYVPSIQTIDLIQQNANIVSSASEYLSAELRKKKEAALALASGGTETLDEHGNIRIPDTVSDVLDQYLKPESYSALKDEPGEDIPLQDYYFE